jgi:hypothetical protein
VKRTIIISALVLHLIQSTVQGQEILWQTGFLGFFDNREYFNSYTQPQTMYGARGFGSIGLAINDHQQISAGIDFLFEFGGRVYSENIKPILYFSHNTEHAKLYLGAFPRIELIKMPNFLLSDTMLYYRPNIEGTFIEFSTGWGFQNIWLDWTSRQTDTDRETFLLGGSGGFNAGYFFYRHDFLMYHYAGPAIALPNDHIRDNGGLNVRIGLDLASKTRLDTFRISTGYAFSYDRLRNIYNTRFYSGGLSEIIIQYRGIGIHTILSYGQGQVQLLGEGIYKAAFYDRSDFYWCFFRDQNLKGRAEFSVHFVPGSVNFSQRLVVTMVIGGPKPLRSVKQSGI